jgi:hypothetical protein
VHGTGRALLTAIVSGAVLASVATTCLAASDTWPVTLRPGSSGETAATGLTVTNVMAACGPTPDQVTVTWDRITVPAGYRVWEATGSPTTFTTVASGVTTATWTSPPLAPGTYWFAVSAGNWDSWTSALSAPTTPVVIQAATPPCTVGTG